MMSTREFFLYLAILPVLWFSADAHAIPISQANGIDPAGDIYFLRPNAVDGGRPEADERPIPGDGLWNWNVGRDNLLSGNYFSGFTLPYGFDSILAIWLSGANLAGFTILDIFTIGTGLSGDAGSSGDADELADFFATLGIAMEDWLTEENPHAGNPSDQSIPPPFIPAATRYPGNECLQQRPGLRENLCPPAGGLTGTGGRSGIGIGGRAGAGPGIGRPGNGINSGIGGIGGGGGGGSSGSGNGAHNIGGNDSDSGNGIHNIGGNGPGSGNSGPDTGGNGPGTGGGSDGNNIVTVPEPTTLALIALGIASICTVRTRKR